jgi:hypothetical protein
MRRARVHMLGLLADAPGRGVGEKGGRRDELCSRAARVLAQLPAAFEWVAYKRLEAFYAGSDRGWGASTGASHLWDPTNGTPPIDLTRWD